MRAMREALVDALRRVMALNPGEPVQVGRPGHTAPLAAQGPLGRQLVGQGYLRPVQEGSVAPQPQGSGARRSRRKRQALAGHVQADGALVTGPVTLTRKGAALLEAAGHPPGEGDDKPPVEVHPGRRA